MQVSVQDRSLRLVNLNLLPVLHAVLKHQNLTRAAEELHVTQSAVSNNLRQLRDHFGDELLVKDGRRLRLTPKGTALLGPLERALYAVHDVVGGTGFVPAEASRTFRIATADYVTAVTAPAMASILGAEAPRVCVQLVTARGRSSGDLRLDTIDLIITPWQVVETLLAGNPKLRNEFSFEPLASEPFVCMARADDEAVRRGLSVEEYLSRPHASFNLDIDFHASLEQSYVHHHNLPQFNRIQTSDFTILPLIAAQSDCIVLVPRSVARLTPASLGLQIATCPLPIPDLELVMLWHRRRDAEPEIAWLKHIVKRAVLTSLATDPV